MLPWRDLGQAARAHGYLSHPAITADDAPESAVGLPAGLSARLPADLCPGGDSVRRPRGSSLGEASGVVAGSLSCEITLISAVAVSCQAGGLVLPVPGGIDHPLSACRTRGTAVSHLADRIAVSLLTPDRRTGLAMSWSGREMQKRLL